MGTHSIKGAAKGVTPFPFETRCQPASSGARAEETPGKAEQAPPPDSERLWSAEKRAEPAALETESKEHAAGEDAATEGGMLSQGVQPCDKQNTG